MKFTKKSVKPYDNECYIYGVPVFSLDLHEIEIAFKSHSKRGKSTHQDEISHMQMDAVGHVDSIIANLKAVKR